MRLVDNWMGFSVDLILKFDFSVQQLCSLKWNQICGEMSVIVILPHPTPPSSINPDVIMIGKNNGRGNENIADAG